MKIVEFLPGMSALFVSPRKTIASAGFNLNTIVKLTFLS